MRGQILSGERFAEAWARPVEQGAGGVLGEPSLSGAGVQLVGESACEGVRRGTGLRGQIVGGERFAEAWVRPVE